MKKLLVVLLALAMVFSMTSFAFAAYDEPEEETAQDAPATDADGNEVDVEQDALPYYDETSREVREADGDAEVLVEVLELTDDVEAALAGTGYTVDDLTILAPVDVYIVGDASDVEFPIDIEFEVPGASEKTPVVVLHKAATGWEVVPCKVIAAGRVVATFNSLSPVVILVADGEPAADPLDAYVDLEDGAWYEEYVRYVADKGYMGVDSPEFGPNWSTLRGDFATVLHRVEGSVTAAASAEFEDIADAQSYMVPAIDWVAEQGLMEGHEGVFRPLDSITREEVFVVFKRLADKKGISGELYATDLSKFDDVADVSDWALDAVNWGVASGLIEGDNGSICPSRNITRAELATLIYRWEKEIAK